MSGWFKGIELSAFKQVDGGYVFRVPNAWFFGPARHYLVNETQRSAIAERLRQIRCGLLPLTFVAAVFMIMLVMFVAVSIQPQGPMRSIALVVLATAALVPTIATAHIYRMHKLAPLIAELPRSNERITLRDMFKLQAANVSLPWLLGLGLGGCALSLLQGIQLLASMQDVGRPPPADRIFFSTVAILCYALMGVWSFALAAYKANRS
jgi:hypothetical protein